MVNDLSSETLRARIVGETARAPWAELQRFFAQGIVLVASPALDLVEVALAVAQDDAAAFQAWLASGEVSHVSDEQAGRWFAEQALVWTVVVKPWVVVQRHRSSDVT